MHESSASIIVLKRDNGGRTEPMYRTLWLCSSSLAISSHSHGAINCADICIIILLHLKLRVVIFLT